MEGINDYNEYEKLFEDNLVIAVRKVLDKIENNGDHDFEDSKEHNTLIKYFNKFALHKKIDEEQFKTW